MCVRVRVCVIFRSSPPGPTMFLRSLIPYIFLASEEGRRRQEEIGVHTARGGDDGIEEDEDEDEDQRRKRWW